MNRYYPSEADSHSASQETVRLLWHPNVHYRVCKNPSQDHIPIHILIPYFLKIRFNIILQPILKYNKILYKPG
jgi:hypothetical protein